MDRRDFLKSSSAAAVALGTATASAANAAKAADDASALAAPAVMPQRRSLRMVNPWPDTVTGPGDHVRQLAKRIEAATDRRWVIEINDVPAADAKAFKAVMTGDADLYGGREIDHRELHPALSYFAGLPCKTGMDIDQLNAWLIAAGGQELWDNLAGQFNMKGLVIGHTGPTHGLFTRQPVHTRADLHGKRIAIDGLAADVLKAIDVAPIEGILDPAAAIVANQTLDGVEISGPTLGLGRDLSIGFHQAAPHRVLPGLNDSGFAITLGLRRSLWEGLATSERIMLSALASEAFAASRADTIAQTRALDLLTDTAAHTNAPSSSDRWEHVSAELARIASSIVADLSGHDALTGQINASYMAFKSPMRMPASA